MPKRSVNAYAARNNKLTIPKRSVNAYVARNTKARRAIFDRVATAKFKELLNFKVRRILRILKFTALKFRSVR